MKSSLSVSDILKIQGKHRAFVEALLTESERQKIVAEARDLEREKREVLIEQRGLEDAYADVLLEICADENLLRSQDEAFIATRCEESLRRQNDLTASDFWILQNAPFTKKVIEETIGMPFERVKRVLSIWLPDDVHEQKVLRKSVESVIPIYPDPLLLAPATETRFISEIVEYDPATTMRNTQPPLVIYS